MHYLILIKKPIHSKFSFTTYNFKKTLNSKISKKNNDKNFTP